MTSPNFSDVKVWIFDLDNTLYPQGCDLFDQVDRRMTDYVRTLLDLPRDVARKVQKDFYRDYGTTLRGLMDCHQIDPDHFLDYVHDIDYSCLTPDSALLEALAQLEGRKIIFTNGSRRHAENVLNQLRLTTIFEAIFDIKDADYVPKPQRAPYEQLCRDFNLDPRRAVMFEDMDCNLKIPHALGLRTVLVVPENHQSSQNSHIDFVTDNLSDFLNQLDFV